MGEIAQLALSNILIFAAAFILIIYIIYLFLKRMVEKSDGDFTSELEIKQERNKSAVLRRFIFTFLYSAMTAGFIYLMDSDKTGAIIYFVVFFIAGSFTPERTREPKSNKSMTGKIFHYIVLLFLLVLFVFFTVTSTASIISKVSAWLILFAIYLLEKIEKSIISWVKRAVAIYNWCIRERLMR